MVTYLLQVFTVAGYLVEKLSGVQAVADDLTFSAYMPPIPQPSVLINGLSVGGSTALAPAPGQGEVT